jgi:hypothetical protein
MAAANFLPRNPVQKVQNSIVLILVFNGQGDKFFPDLHLSFQSPPPAENTVVDASLGLEAPSQSPFSGWVLAALGGRCVGSWLGVGVEAEK